MPASLLEILSRSYGMGEAVLDRVDRGHTNESFAVAAKGGRFILRRSWRGKPAAQTAREEPVLAALAGLPTPRIVRTLGGALHVLDEDRAVHLFTACAGEPAPRWLDAGELACVRAAAGRLAEVHLALARLPTGDGDPFDWLRERLGRVAGGDRVRLPPGADEVLRRIDDLLSPRAAGRIQWLHGDYHLGNLLWQGTQVTGIVDFDDTGRGSPASELAMALFAMSRRSSEDRFRYDRALWEAGLAAYVAVAGREVLPLRPEELEQVFCGYQVLIHLEAAQRGLWSLGAGIGFWPCWNRLGAPAALRA